MEDTQQRRERNRLSARKSRENKRVYQDKLQEFLSESLEVLQQLTTYSELLPMKIREVRQQP